MSIASLGIEFGILNALNLWVAVLLPNKDQQLQLYSLVFHEERPDLGEVRIISREPVVTVPAGAHSVVMPWSNYNRMTSLWLWHGWVEGVHLCAVAGSNQPVARLSLGVPPTRLVPPGLTTRSGEFDVLFLGAGSREMGLARFTPPRGGGEPGGSVVWRQPLSGVPAGASSALGPQLAGSLRRAALIFKEEDGVSVQVFDVGSGSAPGSLATLRIPGHHPVPGCDPGLRIDDQGSTHISLLLSTAPDSTELVVADATLDAAKQWVSPPKLEKARKLPAQPVTGGITFQSRTDRPMRRDWAVLLPDGSVVHSLSQDRPMRPQGKPVTPLQMVARSQATYLLTLRLEGPYLEMLR